MTIPEELGEISIKDEVVATIAAEASQAVEGVKLIGGFSFSEMLSGKKDIEKGVKVEIEGGHCSVTLDIKVRYGIQMYEAAHSLQQKVKDSIEAMTGLIVQKVNVMIKGVFQADKKEDWEQEKE